MTNREIVQIAVGQNDNEQMMVIALASDGTLWSGETVVNQEEHERALNQAFSGGKVEPVTSRFVWKRLPGLPAN
jgi:hypothetical protein